MHKFGEDLGRFFEVGFNIGILTYIQQRKMSHPFGESYLAQLRQLNLPSMMRVIWKRERMIDELDREIVSRWATYFVLRGFLGGLNFFAEYLEALDSRKLPEILYVQAQFYNENSKGTYQKDEQQAYGELLAQLGLDEQTVSRATSRYKKKGEFLRADTLLLLAYRREYRILAVDLSIFFVQAMAELGDLKNPNVLRQLLSREIAYLRSKSQFANLSLDTQFDEILSEGNASLFSQGLQRFYKAFIRQDKESAKLIQAAGYAYSFYTFLKKIGKCDEYPIKFNIVGYSDRGVSAMALGEGQIELLRTCQQIYQKQAREQEIHEARALVLETMKRQAARAFADTSQGKAFLNELLEHQYEEGITCFSYQERITGFVNSVDQVPPELLAPLGLQTSMSLRDGHAELITRALAGNGGNRKGCPYVFLTGNPGIGKTTAIVNFLKQQMDEGFLFLYVSPRKQVNLDIIEKFKAKDGTICDDRVLLLNSTADLIQAYGGRLPTVQYFSNSRAGEFSSCGVKFVDANADHEQQWKGQAKLQRKTEVLIKERGTVNRGVLASLCEALHAVISDKLANNVVATVSIQSLKKTTGGKDTLMHLEKIFGTAYNKREGQVMPAKLQAIARRIRHLIIMVDEITGDQSGVAFLEGLRKFLKKMQLLQQKNGFNTKIIVADASIVDPEVIAQHLSTSNPERDKIFFRMSKARKQEGEGGVVALAARKGGDGANGRDKALSCEFFRFKKQDAIVINANSYPAHHLDISYKIFIEASKYSPDALAAEGYTLEERVHSQIVADILQLLERPDAAQTLVYIQNKRVLGDIIKEIESYREQKQKSFVELEDYVQIHSNLSEEYRNALEGYKNQVKLVFMTSSASRGLSFPKARHLLIAVPSFAIEQNLMEIIQVIYRGRGEQKMDEQGKELTFYLAERAIYGDGGRVRGRGARQAAIQERILTLINMLLILKTSIMTRIQGYGEIGRNRCLMVPVGGKSVSAIGDTFSSRMSTLLRELRQEQYKNPADIALKEIYQRIKILLQRSETRLRQAIMVPDVGAPLAVAQQASYLSLLNDVESTFMRALNRGFDELLTMKPLQAAYTSGSLLIVPLANHHVDESYTMRLWEQLMPTLDKNLERQMWGIVKNKGYSDRLRTSIRQALELVRLLQEEKLYKSQRFEQSSQRNDLYYAIPLFAFVSHKTLGSYFATMPQEPEKASFRDLLSTYIRTITPANGILPIGQTYSSFPFVLFRSYNLEQMRQKRFTDKQLLTSNELNVLNLILSS